MTTTLFLTKLLHFPLSNHRHRHSKMNHLLALPDSSAIFPDDKPNSLAAKCWLDDASILDIDYFVKTLTAIKAKGVRPDLIGSIITHYASKWLPELSGEPPPPTSAIRQSPPSSATASWLKKRFFLETIVAVLPQEKDAVPCSFLLKLLKNANMVGVDSSYREEVEKRIAWRLDQATVTELMIPCFSHKKGMLLDVELVLRLVKKFLEFDIDGVRSGAAIFKVAKLVDAYLAEAAVDSNLGLPEFMELAGAVPAQARATDDGLYRAIDTYLKTHLDVTKKERKMLCKLINSQKLTADASLHAAQNERLPVRSIIQVLFSEQARLNSHIDWSRSFSRTRSPNLGFDPHEQCHSYREVTSQITEIKKLRDNVARLESHCHWMQSQIDKLSEKKRGLFSWKKLATMMMSVDVAGDKLEGKGVDSGSIERQTPLKGKHGRGKSLNTWRKSMS